MAVLSLLLLLAAAHVDVVDEVYTIPPAEWRYVDVTLKQTPVAVQCHYKVLSEPVPVRVALLSHLDLERLRADQPHGFLVATQPQPASGFNYQLYTPGAYAVVVDNREGRGPVRVHLRVALDFSGHREPTVGYLSQGRRLAVILISFAVFFGIVTWSARKILRAMK